MTKKTTTTANALPAQRKDGATYMNLFPDTQVRCASGALEANTSRAAYLVYLKKMIEALETRADVTAPITLKQRRPDLLKLTLDTQSANKALPNLHLVTGLLEKRANEAVPKDQTLKNAVANTMHKGNVPFQYAWASIKTALALKQLPLWDVLRAADVDHPSFLFDNLTCPAQRAATTLSSGFTLQLQALLGGKKPVNSALQGLTTTQAVSKALGLTRKELRRLLAVDAVGEKASTVVLSDHVSKLDYYDGASHLYGAEYINNCEKPLYLTHSDPSNKTVQITGVTDAHLDRLQRILLIQRALEVGPSEADVLLMAALWSEDLEGGKIITPATLRALGLFRHLHVKYGVSAHQYAAFISEISVYGTRPDKSFYDQLFDPASIGGQIDRDPVLQLDGEVFDPQASSGPDALTLKQLCLAFKVDETVLRAVLEWVVEEQGLTHPERSLEVVSACYRLTALPRLFGLKPKDGMLLLAMLNQYEPAYKEQLAGNPSLGDGEAEADIVDVIVGVMDAAQWLKSQECGADQLYLILQSEVTITRPSWASICLGAPLAPDAGKDQLYSALQVALQLDDVEKVEPLLRWSGLDNQTFVGNVRDVQRRSAEKKLAPLDSFSEQDIEDWTLLDQYTSLIKLFELSASTLKHFMDTPEWFDLLEDSGDKRDLDLSTVYLLSRYKALVAKLPTDLNESDVMQYLASVNPAKPGAEPAAEADKAWAALEKLLGEPRDSLAQLSSLEPPTTLGEIDRLLRLLDLSQQHAISMEALVDISRLPAATISEPFEQVSTSLRQSCTAKQRKVMDEQLRLAWRDALVGFLLVHWAPVDPARSEITTPQTLADYLLIDLQVSHEPRTTRVMSAIASLQRYLHQIYSRQETGYRNSLLSEAERNEWSDYASRYEQWKLRQQVRNEPQNFIDPTRRTRKTSAFKDLESLLAQGKCQPQDIQSAMVGYLSTFEKLSNIQPISAYADGTSPLEDTYHFIGKTNVEPVEYYWRTLDLRERDQDGAPSMLAWSEWEKITIGLSGTLAKTLLPKPAALQQVPSNGESGAEKAADSGQESEAEAAKAKEEALLRQDERKHIELIRPVIIAGRRYVVWVEWEATAIALGTDNKASEYYPLRVCFSFQQTDGAWSPANELLRLDGHNDEGKFDSKATLATPEAGSTKTNAFLKTKAYQPGLAVMVNNMGDRINDPWLTVLLFDSTKKGSHTADSISKMQKKNEYFIVSRDLLLLENKTLDAVSIDTRAIENRLVLNWLRFFHDPRVVQHPYVGALTSLEPVGETKTEWMGLTSSQANNYEATKTPNFRFEQQPGITSEEAVISISTELNIQHTSTTYIITHPTYGALLKCSASTHTNNTTANFDTNSYDIKFKITALNKNIQILNEIGYPGEPRIARGTLEVGSIKTYNLRRAFSVYKGFGEPTDEQVAQQLRSTIDAKPYFIEYSNSPQQKLHLPMHLHSHMSDLPVSLTVESKDVANATWTLSASEQKYLVEFKLQSLQSFAKDAPSEFSVFKKNLLKNRHISEFELNPLLNLPAPKHFGASCTLEHAISKAGTLNNAGAMSALIKREVETLEASGVTLPEGLSLESAVRLRHLHPAACRKILLYIDPAHTMPLEDTISAKGDGRVVFRCPLPTDLSHFTFKAKVHDDQDNLLATVSQDFKWQEHPDDAVPSVQIRRNLDQALYLDFSEANQKLADTRVPPLRLNTLFGKQLVALATQSVERALSWEAQCLPEPALASANERTTVDFRSANGLYFWELFFHVPFLVAWQLRQNREYRAAWHWCTRHLFDPYRTWAPAGNYPPLYWMSQPISAPAAYAANAEENDPDLLAYAAPERYRKALHLFVAESWQRQGDDLYRQLTRDTLIEAAICYDNALRLIGTLPEQFSSAPPQALTLASAQPTNFVPPLNNKLVELRNLLRNRLFNLRHGLTLDGKPAAVLLDPQNYNSAALGFGGHGAGPADGIKKARPVPPCHYAEVRKSADAAVLQLIELGQTQLRFYEAEGAQKLALLTKTNIISLLDFPCRLQEQALELAKRGRDTLLASKRMIEGRVEYYQGLLDEGITDLEHTAQAAAYTSQVLKGASIAFMYSSKAVQAAVPTIYGLAFGGNRPSEGIAAVGMGMEFLGEIANMAKDELRLQAEYQLRGQEWQFETDQANLELQIIDRQLLEQDIHVRAARIAVDEARAKLTAHQAEYQLMTTVFASHPTYLWLISRMADIYSSTYDATLSLCLMAEASLQYELGDFTSTWIRTDGWLDNWRGMLAGEALERDLIQMDLAAINDNERPLDIRLDLSLCKCMNWDTIKLQERLKTGKVIFSLTSRHFDQQYPGHYLRRIERITLTFKNGEKNISGPVAAMLTQSSNTLLLSNDSAGVQCLYLNREDKEGEVVSLLRDLRRDQRIAIWSAKEVNRNFDLQPGPKDETRYQPFEGTGAISSWVLEFPGGIEAHPNLFEKDKCLVTDIEIHIAYSAMDGGPEFRDEVKKLMTSSSTPAQTAEEGKSQADADDTTKRKKETEAAEAERKAEVDAAAAEARRKADADAAAAEAKRKADADVAAAEAKRKADADAAAAEAKRKADADAAAAEAKRKAEAKKKADAAKRKAVATSAVNAAKQAEQQALDALKRAESDAKEPALKAEQAPSEAKKAAEAIILARTACTQATAARKRAEKADETGNAEATVVASNEAKQAAEEALAAAKTVAAALQTAKTVKSPAELLATAKKLRGSWVRVDKKNGYFEIGTLKTVDEKCVVVVTKDEPGMSSESYVYMHQLANITKAKKP
ncbi:neuraminidase-like domain-containing protein [Pseudomonas shirazensis]|uniref:Tc toxin subunit A-related protein n=1 Tax=Pseudomonas shirazensis TaxID=2745494 RepID=UPI003D283231